MDDNSVARQRVKKKLFFLLEASRKRVHARGRVARRIENKKNLDARRLPHRIDPLVPLSH